MRIGDIEEEFRKHKAALESADAQMKLGQYQPAAATLQKLLEQLDILYAGQHPAIARCLEGLADCSYHLHRYDAAVTNYARLFSLLKNDSDTTAEHRLQVLFKLAKSYGKNQQLDNEKSTYEEAANLSRASVGESHPLTLNIMDGYASVLRKCGLTEQALAVEQTMKAKRRPDASGMRGILHQIMRAFPQKSDTTTQEPVDSGSESGSITESAVDTTKLRHLADHRRSSPATIRTLALYAACTAIGICVTGALIVWSVSNRDASTRSISSKFVPRTWSSADGLRTLELLSPGEAELTNKGMKARIPYVAVEKANFLDSFTSSLAQGHTWHLRENPAGLLSEDGTQLYSSTAPELALVGAMRKLGDALNAAFQTVGEYPQEQSQLDQIVRSEALLNSFTKRPLHATIQFAGTPSSAAEATNEAYTLQYLRSGSPINAEPAGEMGDIHVYYTLSGSADTVPKATTVFIRAFDFAGHLFSGEHSNESMVLQCNKGITSVSTTSSDSRAPQFARVEIMH